MQKNSTTPIRVNKVKVAFSKKMMTAYGGLSLMASFFKQIRLREAIESAVPVQERSPNSTGVYSKIIMYFSMVYAGAERFAHAGCLGNKALLAALFGVKRMPEAATSLTRFFNKIKNFNYADTLSYSLWLYLAQLIQWEQIVDDWLTFDSTVLIRYGEQEGAKKGYNPKKHGRPSHHPLIAFLNRSNYVIHLWNRSGNVTSWNNVIAFFTASFERVRNRINVLGVVADSGFYVKQFIEILEENRLIYIVAVRLFRPLQREIYGLATWKSVDRGIWITEFSFMHQGWGRERRYIVVRQDVTRRTKAMGKTLPLFAHEMIIRDYRYSVWVTNSMEAPYEVWTKCKPRANDENTIKELKESFALGGFSMERFYAVEAAMVLRVFAYNLFLLFKQIFLGQKEKRQQLKTLRYKYFVLPAQMGNRGRDAILRISVMNRKIRSKLFYLFTRISQHIPRVDLNCIAVERQ